MVTSLIRAIILNLLAETTVIFNIQEGKTLENFPLKTVGPIYREIYRFPIVGGIYLRNYRRMCIRRRARAIDREAPGRYLRSDNSTRR